MTDSDFNDVTRVLTQLWPSMEKRWNHEVAIVWRNVCGNHPVGEIVRELRGLAEHLKYPAKPSDLRDAMARAASRKAATAVPQGRREPLTLADQCRGYMRAWGTIEAAAITAMTDAEVMLEWARNDFAGASRVYAPVIKGVDYRGVPVPDLDRDGVYVSPTLRMYWDKFQAAMAKVEQEQGVTA